MSVTRASLAGAPGTSGPAGRRYDRRVDRDEWLARRTYRGADYDPERVADALRRQGLTVSVCLPTLDVADTVGPIVERVRRELVERVPLVAEVVAIDSRSGDATRAVAAEAGATVVQDHEVLPDLPPARGKGEALWKSLAVLRGDIVVWLDSDVVDFDPAFVTGLVGPLAGDPGVGYVKALYRRANVMSSDVKIPAPAEATLAELRRRFEPEVRELATLIGRPLDSWM